jgi:hypothetical protein
MSPNKDRTGNERQQRRREREKAWLAENGFKSWEALHTALLSGKARLTPRAADLPPAASLVESNAKAANR